MSAIIRQNFPQALLPFIGKFIGLKYEDKDSVYDKVFNVFKMDHAFEQDVQNYGAGLMNLTGEQDPIQFDTMAQTWIYTYTAVKYSTGFVISMEEMDDSKYLDIAKLRANEVAKSAKITTETICATVINNATNNAVTYGDGVSLLSPSHPIGIGPNLSNMPVNPVDLCEAALEQASIDISDYRNERNLRMEQKIKGLLLPKELRFESHRILKSDGRPYTADNDTNALKDLDVFSKDPIIWNYLNSPTAWYVLLENENGLKFGEREKLKLDADNDFVTKAARFSAIMRCVAGASDTYRAIYGTPGA